MEIDLRGHHEQLISEEIIKNAHIIFTLPGNMLENAIHHAQSDYSLVV